MTTTSLLIANRGEIAVRIIRAAAELGLRTVALYSQDDAESLHTRLADAAVALPGVGAAAYLDIQAIVAAAQETGCDAVHPGYGFLSESAAFAQRCVEARLTFVGPRAELLELFGDKVRARLAAQEAGVPVLAGSSSPVSLTEARAFYEALPDGSAVVVKAVVGGGGRGVRVVESPDQLQDTYERCRSEARAAFGNDAVYVEELMRRARHVEVQVAGDRTGTVIHLGERDCSIQRRHQKLIEIAPSPGLPQGLRDRLHAAALQLARSVRYESLGTIEFLVDASELNDQTRFAFIEANPRLQVEHTVSEEVTGVDLVRLQLELADGATLADLGLGRPPTVRGFAMQVRVNTELIAADGSVLPSSGTLSVFAPPHGPGVRVDTYGYPGYTTNPRFDSLLAKIVAHTNQPRFDNVVTRAARALREFQVEGVRTNTAFLSAILRLQDFHAARLSTRFIADHQQELLDAATVTERRPTNDTSRSTPARAGAHVDAIDPLAVLAYGQTAARASLVSTAVGDGDGNALRAPIQGTIVSVAVEEGASVRAGQALVIMEAMKMEHEIRAERSGVVQRVLVVPGDTIYPGSPLLLIEPGASDSTSDGYEAVVDLDEIRPDLRDVLERHQRTLDVARPDAVARRRAKGQRTARENVEDLCDPDTFIEYGPLVLAAQRSRRSLDELIVKSPADGMITGVGRVNGQLFAEPISRCVIMSYDYTVFAGTQGTQNHRKTDRMIDIAERGRMPIILFAEGGGGRPGDTDRVGGSGQRTFSRFAQLSGLVPMIGITSGRCFAGNASLLGCCDVIIATADSNIGMGGPAMIEGGGLGVFAPEEIGPMEIHRSSGVVDIAVKDEAEAVLTAKRYLSYFQGPLQAWECADQRRMRQIVPENRLRVYAVRSVIETLADTGSVLELRPDFGHGMVTALVRVEGQPLGVIANNPAHLGGAIDSDAADKGARFMQLCDAFDLPILSFCDTPGIMVGPEVEKTALVRHSSRLFLTAANLTVPLFTVVLRKAYGLGAIAMAAGSYKAPYFTVAWPTGEFWGMGIEGSVKLGFRNELAMIEDPEQRRKRFDAMVADAYERARALNEASTFGVDDTIDPADTRRWVAGLLRSIRPPALRPGKKRSAVDAW